jgi:hypothetical protein
MSTPSGKPFDLSFYPSNREHDRAEHESHDDTLRSPYAPKRAGGRIDAEPTTAPDMPELPLGDRDYDASAPIAPSAPVDLDAEAAAHRAAADSRPERRPPLERVQRGFSEHDIERLESSLRWLQREEAANRLLRNGDKPARPSFDDGAPALRRRPQQLRSLEPERMAPPPDLGSRRSYWPLYVLVASAFGAGIAYFVAAPEQLPSSAVPPRPQVASYETTSGGPAPVTLERQRLFPTVARDDDALPPNAAQSAGPNLAASEAAPRQAAPPAGKSSQLARLEPAPAAPAPPAAATPAAATPAPQPAPVAAPVRTLDPEAIKLLVEQGDQFVAAGDLVTARTVFQRAAEAGDATAAMALAATYDPLMLTKLGVVGVEPNLAKARAWYQRAENLGLPEATRRLSLLANQ